MTLGDLVSARNRQLAGEAAIQFGLGLLVWSITLAFIFWISFLVGFFVPGWNAWVVAWIVTGTFALVSFYSAWRGDEPTENVSRLTEVEEQMMLASLAVSGPIGMQPRHAVAGAGALLIGGPAALLEARATWHHRLPADETTVRRAAALLEECENGSRLDTVGLPRAAILLHRLALIKVESRNDVAMAVLTERGRALLAGEEVEP